jgi:transaldolase
MLSPLKELAKHGVSIWLDDLNRPLIQTGELARMVNDGEIVGITTNPTIFAKAIGAGPGMKASCENWRCGERRSARRCVF